MSGLRGVVIGAAVIATAAFVEAGLRLWPELGFTAERWIAACQRGEPDTPLNHAPSGPIVQRLEPASVYGEAAGGEYEERYDENGIKRSALRPQDGEGTRVLFMGDSFIEGYDDANTVPQHAYEWIAAHGHWPRPLILLNAGYSSYSPLIFTVQARRLLPALRPDFLVIDVDETDLFDDAVRYRQLAVRDRQGKLVAVAPDPELRAVADGCADAGRLPLHLMRLAASAYYQLRVALHDWRARRGERLFAVAQAQPGALPPELRAHLAYFATTLDELFATVLEYLPADRVLVVRHPHRWHLSNREGAEPWNRLVGGQVGEAAARHGIAFFDGQDELAAAFGNAADRYYWPGDMHFNFAGLRAYGDLVGRELLRTMASARRREGS